MLVAHAALKAVFFSPAYLVHVALPVERATRGLVTTVTLAGAIEWAVLVGVLMLGVGALRPRDLGLTGASLRRALPILAALWAALQVAHVSVGSVVGPVDLAGPPSAAAWAGPRLQAVVGSGLIEETLYRGFLLVQVYAWLRRRRSRESALAWAVVATSLYFGLNHVPAGLRAGHGLASALGYAGYAALGGALFASLYLRTGNLFVAAGAHALINDPMAMASTAIDPSLVALVGVSVLLLAWPWLAQRLGRGFTIGTVEGTPAL